MKFSTFTVNDIRTVTKGDFIKRLYDKAINEEDLLSNAAQIGFYFAFAMFPLLLFLISIFGIVLGSTDDMQMELFNYLRQVMPVSAFDLVQKTIVEVSESSSGGKLTFGLLIALYSASAGIESLRIGLNGVYNLTETRSWLKTKALSILFTLLLSVLIFLALGLVFYGSKLLALALETINLPIPSPTFLTILQVLVAIVVLLSIFALIYGYLPDHAERKWVWITPGAVTGIILWVGFSYSFKVYLSYFDSYDKTYGSLGAVIILLLWLYLTALVLLLGATINAVLQEFTDPETAEAGLKKSAAKEIVNNPEMVNAPQAEALAQAITEIAAGETGKPALAAAQTLDRKHSEEAVEKIVFVEPDMERVKQLNQSVPISLIVGGAFGFLAGLIFKNKNK